MKQDCNEKTKTNESFIIYFRALYLFVYIFTMQNMTTLLCEVYPTRVSWYVVCIPGIIDFNPNLNLSLRDKQSIREKGALQRSRSELRGPGDVMVTSKVSDWGTLAPVASRFIIREIRVPHAAAANRRSRRSFSSGNYRGKIDRH